MPELANSHILVCPDGPSNSWNIKGEESDEDDQLYVGTTLVNHLATFDNVQASFKLYGYSNGAALTNRILIENDDARITHAMTDGSQLNTLQFHSDTFWIGGASNDYTAAKTGVPPLAIRAVLQIVGGADRVIPAAGGNSIIGDGTANGKLAMLSWEDSAHAIAEGMGYGGSALPLAVDNSTVASVSYLNGQIVAYNLKEVGHVAGPSNALSRAAVLGFLGIAQTVSPSTGASRPTGGGASASPSGAVCSFGCEEEFERCVAYGSNTYASCRNQLDNDCACPLITRGGCSPGCADTENMAVLDPSYTASSTGGLSGGAIGAICGGVAVVVIVGLGIVYKLACKAKVQGSQKSNA